VLNSTTAVHTPPVKGNINERIVSPAPRLARSRQAANI
jgi:hypothetical protein